MTCAEKSFCGTSTELASAKSKRIFLSLSSLYFVEWEERFSSKGSFECRSPEGRKDIK